jgi:ABC-2 type transport system ATP-binding protein
MRQRVKLAQALVARSGPADPGRAADGHGPADAPPTIRLIKDWARAGKHIIVSSHILHEIESMTSNILLINNGRIVAEGNVHQIRDLIDTHPHTVHIVRGSDPGRSRASFLAEDDVLS